MATLIVVIAVLVALDLAVLRWGIDTRRGDGSDWDWSRGRPLVGGHTGNSPRGAE
jgi:hypothetical protein